MKEKVKAKAIIIKKGQKAVSKAPKVIKSAKESAREIVENVTNWVNELRAKKDQEAKKAIRAFFNNNAKTSES
ncbi:MAG TPA: hypothetical protein VNK26_04340 [Pyrinomonadaceae bacterium]|nr:hypothetical protein [Pyrinomonadaceae bacterium]